MTKRAGKRKFRMGSQRHPPGKIVNGRPDTFQEDNLKPHESLRLEIQAVCKGWLSGPEDVSRLAKIRSKLLKMGEATEDADVLTKIFRTLCQADQQIIRNLIAAEGMGNDKPIVVVQQNNNSGRDTLQEFIDSLTPDQAVDWLNSYGDKFAGFVPPVIESVSGEPETSVSS